MIKFKRVNGWTYKTEDNQYIVYNGGPNVWYSGKVDQNLVKQYGYEAIAVDDASKKFHSSLRLAQLWVREVNYKVGA